MKLYEMQGFKRKIDQERKQQLFELFVLSQNIHYTTIISETASKRGTKSNRLLFGCGALTLRN